MTICVAVPVVNLKTRPHIRFVEPAVIIAADSRISFVDGRPPDDKGVKVGKLSDFAIAGFAGSVAIAYGALNALVASGVRKPREVAPRAKELLQQCFQKAKAKGLSDDLLATKVLLAVRYEKHRFSLYKLSWDDDFIPRRVDGVIAIGDGSKEFEQAFKEEYESIVISWQRRSLGPGAFQGGTNRYHDDLTCISPGPKDQPMLPGSK